RALEPLLGREGCRELQAKLIARAAAWARKVGAAAPHVAHDPPDAGSELRRLVGSDAVLFPQNGEGITGRLADASARVLARSGGPLLIVWPDLPRFRVVHAAGAPAHCRAAAAQRRSSVQGRPGGLNRPQAPADTFLTRAPKRAQPPSHHAALFLHSATSRRQRWSAPGPDSQGTLAYGRSSGR